MKHTLLFLLLLGYVFLELKAQTSDELQIDKNCVPIKFLRNIVRLEKSPEYGLLIGDNGKTGSRGRYYLIVIQDLEKMKARGEDSIRKHIRIHFNEGVLAASQSATYKGVSCRISDRYWIGLYSIRKQFRDMEKTYMVPTQPLDSNHSAGYYTIRDSGDLEASPLFYVYCVPFLRFPDEPRRQQGTIALSSGMQPTVLRGTPLLDTAGNLCGIVSQAFNDDNINPDNSIHVLDIYTVFYKLAAACQEIDLKPCRIFSIMPKDAQGRSFCQLAGTLLAKQKAPDKANRYDDWDKYQIDTLHAAGRPLTPRQRAIRERNIDWLSVITAGGNAMLSGLRMHAAPGSGKSRPPISISGGYGFGIGIHLWPDSGKVRFTIKARYNRYFFRPGNHYDYGDTTTQFNLNQVAVSTWEFPVQIEFPVCRRKTWDAYWAVGYTLGRQLAARYSFFENAAANANGTGIPSPQRYDFPVEFSHKVQGEIGWDHERVRLAVYGSYQFAGSYPKDYAITLTDNIPSFITPFRDIPHSYFTLGLDCSVRLWGQWRNDYRTIF